MFFSKMKCSMLTQWHFCVHYITDFTMDFIMDFIVHHQVQVIRVKRTKDQLRHHLTCSSYRENIKNILKSAVLHEKTLNNGCTKMGQTQRSIISYYLMAREILIERQLSMYFVQNLSTFDVDYERQPLELPYS